MSNTLAKLAQVCPLWVYKLFPFLRWWPSVDAGTARTDAMAGLTGALIVLPQGVAFATIAGLPPAAGTMKRLPGEFHQALQLLADRDKTDTPATLLTLRHKTGPEEPPR